MLKYSEQSNRQKYLLNENAKKLPNSNILFEAVFFFFEQQISSLVDDIQFPYY